MSMPYQEADEAKTGCCVVKRWMRGLVLLVLVIQNCSLMMVTGYSRSLPGPKYLTSTAVLAGEILKSAVVLGVLISQHGLHGTQAAIREDVFGARGETLRYAVPSIFYTLQNNLWYYALSNLDTVTAAVTSQFKIITTAVFSMIILSKELNHLHWSGLGLLMLGLVIMKAGPSDRELSSGGHYYLGMLAMLAACTSSGYAGIYLEKIFKQLNASVWTANLRLQFFCLPIAALTMLLDLDGLMEGGLFYGWNSVTCIVVLLNALGGFVVSLTMKYADNILKTFAVSMSLVLNCLLSSAFQSVHLTSQAITGVGLVIIATFLYSIANSAGDCGCKAARNVVNRGYLPVGRAGESEAPCAEAGEDEEAGREEEAAPGEPQIIGSAAAGGG